MAGKWRALDRHERWIVIQAAAILPVTCVLARVLPLPLLLRRAAAPVADVRISLPAPLRTAALVNAVAQRMPRAPSCFPRSLCLQWLLRRRGFDCVLRLGTRIETGKFEAHAWVEIEGRALNDPAAATFGAFFPQAH